MVRDSREVIRTADRAAIAGGFVLMPVARLVHAWAACRSGPLKPADFRSFLAAHEMVARRGRIEVGRAPSFNHGELARLLGITERRAGASARRLVAAGLIGWGDGSIAFPGPATVVPGVAFEATIGGGRGVLAIPRRMLRHLARGGSASLIGTALGVLLRCLSRRKAGWDGRGRVKASWIARAFGVDLRRVKAARAELIALGWLQPEPTDQRAENRWGRAYRINLAWAARGSAGRRLPPLPAFERAEIATPSVDQDPLRGCKNQEPAHPARRGGPLAAGARMGFGSEGRGQGGEGCPGEGEGRGAAGPSPRWPTPAGPVRPSLDPAMGDRAALAGPLPAPRLDDVRPEDLADIGRTLDLHRQAVARKLADPSEAGRLRFLALAEHARSIGARNPGGLFASLLRRGAWAFATQAEEDRAARRLGAFLRGPAPDLVAKVPGRPPLPEDARIVREVVGALAAKGHRGDPFLAFRRYVPGWDRARWDAASSALETAWRS